MFGLKLEKLNRQRTEQIARTYFTTLTDFTFQDFLTVRLFPYIYGGALAVTALSILYITFEAFLLSAWRGLFFLLFAGPLAFIAVATMIRAVMEFYIVIFRIAENVEELVELRESVEKISGLSDTVGEFAGFTRRLPFWKLVLGAPGRKPERPLSDAETINDRPDQT